MSPLPTHPALERSLSLTCGVCGQTVHNCYVTQNGATLASHHGLDIRRSCEGSGVAQTRTQQPNARIALAVEKQSIPKVPISRTSAQPRTRPLARPSRTVMPNEPAVGATPAPRASVATFTPPRLTPKAEIPVGAFDPSNGRYPMKVLSPADYVKLFDEGQLDFQQRGRVRPSHLPTRDEAEAWSKLKFK